MKAINMNQNHVMLSEYMVDGVLKESNLTRHTNPFFLLAKKEPKVSADAAIRLAVNWREITKQFLFTVLTGLGTLAEETRKATNPSYDVIAVLQSGIKVISDDLSNICPILNEAAPEGPLGAHYIWWENSVLNVILNKNNTENTYKVSSKVQKLLDYMVVLSKEPFGAAVQLRIVEAIAMDIAIAFRGIYSLFAINEQKIFPNVDDLAWINAHIKAEVAHHKQVKNDDSGMVKIAITPEEQRTLLVLTKEYVDCWNGALNDFEQIIQCTTVGSNDISKDLAKSTHTNKQTNKNKWYCLICDFIYDEVNGLPDEGIPAGTAFEDIPSDWVCSDCGVSKRDFALLIDNQSLAS